MRKSLFIAILLSGLFARSFAIDAGKLPAERTVSEFYGFPQYRFNCGDAYALVVEPKKAAPGNPWIWRARFFGHQPQTDIALLEKGFHLAYIDVADLFGGPPAVARFNSFYNYLTGTLGLSRKPVLEGMSRGGLIVMNWAKQNPDKVSAIYLDAPVCDFNSWPGAKGKGLGSAPDYERCLRVYNLTPEQALTYPDQPKDRVEALARAGVPILAVCGATDEVVRMEENIDLLAEHYRAAGGNIRVIAKPGTGHHPHSLKDPAVIVNFLEANTLGRNRFLNPRRGAGGALKKFADSGTGRVAFIGGSITEMNGYTKGIEDGLRKLFPQCEFEFINAGLSSTCSDTGAFRLEREVLSRGKLDLLFVEFAVNDNQDGHLEPERAIRAMEGIVRQVRKQNPEAQIVFLYAANESHLADYGKNAVPIHAGMKAADDSTFDNRRGEGAVPREIAAHEAVAEHYGIPSVNFAADLEERMRHGEFDWEKFGGVHPAPFGAEIYTEDVMNLLRGQLGADGRNPPLPPPLDPKNLEHGRLIPPDACVIQSGWQLGVPDWNAIPGQKRDHFIAVETVYSELPGAELTLNFNGTAIGLYLTAGIDAGTVEYRIDGSEWKTRDLFHHFSPSLHDPYPVVLDDTLSDGPHVLNLRVGSDQNQKSTGHAVRIMNFAAN